MLKLVPFNANWEKHDKLDLHAIYRRPARVEDEYGDLIQARGPDGSPLWDLTCPLPIRQHSRWVAKGFEYVTLANAQGPGGALRFVHEAYQSGTLSGGGPRDYAQDPRTGGPWNAKKYFDGQRTSQDEGQTALERDVYEFGSNAVEKIRRRTDPGFTLPAHLRNIAPNDEPPAEPTAVSVTEGRPVPSSKRTRTVQ
jgi:hypothetical protein